MGTSSSTHLDPTLKEMFPKTGPETDEVIHSFYTGKQMARSYAAYRPRYPAEIFDTIMSYHEQIISSGHQLAVDVCCGTGQSTLPLTKLFHQVVGVDVSEDQVENMPKGIPNLTTYVGLAEDLNMIESGTVDLVTIATGLHWVNTKKFLLEAKRVLKPGGTFAAYTWLMDQLDDAEANRYYRQAFAVFKDYNTSRPMLAMEKYQSIDFPFSNIRRFDIPMREEMSIDQFVGCIQSIHATNLYYQDHPGTNVLEEIRSKMTSLLSADGKRDTEVRVKMTKHFFLLLGRNK